MTRREETLDNTLNGVTKRLDGLQERLEFFKNNQKVRDELEITYTMELERLRYHKQPEQNLKYLRWLTDYLGWSKEEGAWQI